MIISHNLQAMNTNRIANTNLNLYGKSLEKVSSGYKINHVGDNPVGIALSEKMRRQIRGLNRGIENTKAGISFCKVADGALNEVAEILQRLNKLSVQSETGTNTLADRQAIQTEVEQLQAEIDRIADTTAFNEIPVFRGTEQIIVPGTGGSVIEGNIPFTDFTIADVNLGASPFDRYSDADILNLQAIVNNENSDAHGRTYNLIYGSGNTSQSSFRLTYQNADGSTEKRFVNMSELDPLRDEYATDDNSWWQRSFKYENDEGVIIKVTQKVTAVIPTDPAQEKKYNISYSFANMSESKNVTLDFMFNADTAYNDIDNCEGYFINDGSGSGSRLDKWSIFTNGNSWSGSDRVVSEGISDENVKSSLPDSFSIIDVDNALAFSEKISFVSGSEPNVLSVGQWSQVHEWDYYDLVNANNSPYFGEGGQTSTDRADIAFSLFWNQNINSGAISEISFNYGIIAYQNDDNLSDVVINNSPNVIGGHGPHYGTKSLWIQTGNEKGSGLWLEIDEMNTEVLGIDKLDLTTIKGAAEANILVKDAIQKLSESRSKIGAQQNRLEHTVANEENVSEKVSASESGIRDTDISSEMVRYSNLSILLKMGQAMINEANEKIEKIMTVLQ